MRLGPIPENIIERILMRLGLLPAPLLDTQVAYTLARTIMLGMLGMLGVHANVFDAEGRANRCPPRSVLRCHQRGGDVGRRGDRRLATRRR